jgi:vacuolar-type H+-ATPase subunit I/STV1
LFWRGAGILHTLWEHNLTYFHDEYLSHYLWHIGVVGLAALLIYEGWHQSVDEKTDWRIVLPAGILYGFTSLCIFLERNTLILGLPFVMIVSLLVIIWGRRKLIQKPILAFFFVAALFALMFFYRLGNLLGWLSPDCGST